MKKLMDAKKKCPAGEKPKAIKTHLRDCIVLPNMVQSMVSIYNGKVYNNVEIKPEMIGYYLGEYSMTYKKVTAGKAGVVSSLFYITSFSRVPQKALSSFQLNKCYIYMF